jgi:hypothetical protein
VLLEGLGKLKKFSYHIGIKPVIWLVAQFLNQLRYHVLPVNSCKIFLKLCSQEEDFHMPAELNLHGKITFSGFC